MDDIPGREGHGNHVMKNRPRTLNIKNTNTSMKEEAGRKGHHNLEHKPNCASKRMGRNQSNEDQQPIRP